MTPDQAFELLDLPIGSPRAATEDRFRVLAAELHPDKGGDEERMKALNVSRDVALAYVSPRGALVPVEVVREIVTVATSALVQRQEHGRETERVTARIKKQVTGSLKTQKGVAALVGGVSAAALFLGKDLPDTFFSALHLAPEMSAMFSATALLMGMSCAVMYWMASRQIESATDQIDELNAYLSFRSNFVNFIAEVTEEREQWTLDDLEHMLSEWRPASGGDTSRWKWLVHRIGTNEFSRLLLTKGFELELLDRKEKVNGQRLTEHYGLVHRAVHEHT